MEMIKFIVIYHAVNYIFAYCGRLTCNINKKYREIQFLWYVCLHSCSSLDIFSFSDHSLSSRDCCALKILSRLAVLETVKAPCLAKTTPWLQPLKCPFFLFVMLFIELQQNYFTTSRRLNAPSCCQWLIRHLRYKGVNYVYLIKWSVTILQVQTH